MSSQKISIFLKMAAATLALSGMNCALAENAVSAPFVPQWYVGTGISADSRFSDSSEIQYINPKGKVVNAVAYNNNSVTPGIFVFGGYRAATHWAFELGYYSQGTNTVSYSLPKNGLTGIEKGQDYDTTLSTLFTFPVINSGFSAYVRAGLGYHTQKSDISDADLENNDFTQSHDTDEGTRFIYGFGAQYNVVSHFALRAEYTLFDANAIIQNLNGGRASLSAVYNF